MGGIAAILSRAGEPDLAAARRMLAAAPHRGDQVRALRHGRCVLAVSDRPDGTETALESEDGRAAAFVGTLDNADELAKDLDRRGVHPFSMTPAGLVLAAFHEFGDDAPAHLRGAFVAAVTDGRRLLACRDHVGFETLFCRRDRNGFYAASEAKQIVAGAGIPREPDLEILRRIFYTDIVDHRRCSLRGVERVLAGTSVSSEDGTPPRRYWDPSHLLETARLAPGDVAERFAELMDRAVARTLTGADAVALSGGIDSPAVAAFAAPEHLRRSGRPIGALSSVYPSVPSADERDYIEEVASFLGMPLHTYTPQPQRLDRLADWVWLFDGPWSIWSPFGAEEQLALARDLGFRTILTGNLAEQVASMQRFLSAHLLARGRLGALTRYLGLQRSEGSSLYRLVRQCAAALVPQWLVGAYLRYRPALAAPPWIDRRRAGAGASRGAAAGRRLWVANQVGVFADGSSLSLEASAICQVRAGVRIRMPWADVDLWEFFVSLPAEVKFPEPQSKALIRRLLRGRVPDRILDRADKTVLNDWFQTTSIDYPSLRRWLLEPRYRMPGVDYDALASQLARESLDVAGYVWAKDLAAIHAFLEQW